ncbi:MAG: hypothetical protein M0D53_01400 [Flavobacterium sp. JAD_PAG50586_2]|nr:MAG: hypothetical protein M0D53_01400 [Flavobacterium sp. JAD_PAG50586_2]
MAGRATTRQKQRRNIMQVVINNIKNMRIAILSLALTFTVGIRAQVGIGTTNPDPSSILELSSSSKGFLMTRVALQSTTDATTVLAPATGLLVYNTAAQNDILPGFYYWDSSWKPLQSSSGSGTSWLLSGNTVSNSHFLGSVNYAPLNLKVNNTLAGRIHPNGGIALGINAAANDSNSVAIGSGATATANVDATALGLAAVAGGYRSTAIGYSANASSNNTLAAGYSASASGFQSLALGMNASATQNNTSAVGYTASATAYQAAAFGTEAAASGQSATAIGYQATATQANSIILGSSSNAANKVGIGTNTPDERLHVNGNFKLTDGTQANGYALISDANGKASWQNLHLNDCYAGIYYNSSGQTMNQYANISFGTALPVKNATVDTDGITVQKAGTYRITYSVALSKSGGSSIDAGFQLYKDYSTAIPGSYTIARVANNSIITLEKTVVATLSAYQKVSVRPTISDSNTTYVSGAESLLLELLE